MRRKTWHERTGRLFVRRYDDGNLRGRWAVDCPCCVAKEVPPPGVSGRGLAHSVEE